ncbi:MAG: nitrogen regulation protein NR(I) [Porticoccus sp.]|nr:nitrogen regulation protein NR(I) [Porticoccus sp.]
MDKRTVWIVDDDRSIRWVMEKALARAELKVTSFENASDLLIQLDKTLPDTIISDIRMPGIDGLQLLKKIHTSKPSLPVIITTAHSDLDSAVAAYQGGAFEYLPKPFDIDELIAVTQRAINFAQEQKTEYIKESDIADISDEIIGEAPAMQEVFRAIGRLSHSNITVLINGESGTGKELVAKALHDNSPRKNNRFIALNMAAIPHDLIESELFGHEKGAFTGATQRREGRFQQADGGTLFLDEIGDMPPEAQTRLLRVLANGEFYLVGGHTPSKVDVRIIAATHQNLEQLVAENRFREDLFHRLNVIRIHLPTLADRREDIPRLMQYFLQRAAKELETETKTLSPEAKKHLTMLPWEGNVRQLENACRWLTVMASGREIHIDDLPPEFMEHSAEKPAIASSWEQQLRNWADNELANGKHDILTTAVPTFERALIETALSHTNGRKKDAAELLGWGRNTLTRKLKELGMEGGEE